MTEPIVTDDQLRQWVYDFSYYAKGSRRDADWPSDTFPAYYEDHYHATMAVLLGELLVRRTQARCSCGHEHRDWVRWKVDPVAAAEAAVDRARAARDEVLAICDWVRAQDAAELDWRRKPLWWRAVHYQRKPQRGPWKG